MNEPFGLLGDAHAGRAQRGAAPRIAVVIPCYRAAATVEAVIRAVPDEVERIYAIDDACPEGTAERLARGPSDPRLVVLRNGRNFGVGGAVKRGYRAALADGFDIVVKIDADGQMDPAFIPRLIAPIAAGHADYAKGNRFGRRHLMPDAGGRASGRMPALRRVGNNFASFLHKGVTGQ